MIQSDLIKLFVEGDIGDKHNIRACSMSAEICEEYIKLYSYDLLIAEHDLITNEIIIYANCFYSSPSTLSHYVKLRDYIYEHTEKSYIVKRHLI
tara:strand:+ start:200 stop:481 length:282 start_codon:yes stop_codon:yes gene_type:complete